MDHLMYIFSKMSAKERDLVLAYAERLLKCQEDGTDPDEMEPKNECKEISAD